MEKKNVSTPSSNRGTSDPRSPFARSTARSPAFEGEGDKRGSGRTSSKPQPSRRGVERFARIVVLPVLLLMFWVGVLACGREERATSGARQNNPPTITSVTLLPENPNHESDLSLVVQCEDPEGDSMTYEVQWMVNDREISAGDGSLLKSGNFKKGDSIRVKVTPSDGKTQGKPFLSPVVRINNSLPVIEKVWIEPKVVHAQDQLKVVVESSDKDKDFVYYTYQWEKNGTILTEEKGETLESGQFKKGDSLSVVVVADDREARWNTQAIRPCRGLEQPPHDHVLSTDVAQRQCLSLPGQGRRSGSRSHLVQSQIRTERDGDRSNNRPPPLGDSERE